MTQRARSSKNRPLITIIAVGIIIVVSLLIWRSFHTETAEPKIDAPLGSTSAGTKRMAASSREREQGVENTGSVAVTIKKDENGTLFFDLSMAEFISRYNWNCRHDKTVARLPEPEQWNVYATDQGIHSNDPVLNYVFSNEEAADFYPNIQVSVSEESGRVQEIAVDYDDHDYREETYREFDNLCFYSLKSLRPEIENQRLSKFIKTVNNSDVPPGKAYEHGIVPSALYQNAGVGVYPYRQGWSSMYFCVIPVNEDQLQRFQAKGTEICEAF